MSADKKEPLNYASAVIHFLDRDSGLTKAMTYPITRIELLHIFNDKLPETFKKFRVDDNGHWQEEQ